ncbi:MAG: hypothetical protein II161_06675 [Erysipelotrichaceae bacterium]|nr:hypothetical protein [Erysipelotrichaceae bacterium]
MKKLLSTRKARITAVLTVFLMLTGCSKDKPLLPTPTPGNEVTPTPAEPTTTVYYADMRVKPEVSADFNKASVQITASRFSYYRDPFVGFMKYHLIIEFKNTGNKALFTPGCTVKLYNGDQMVDDSVLLEPVYGIIAPGATDYISGFGYLKTRNDKGSYDPLEIDLSKALVPEIDRVSAINTCDMSTYTFIDFETDISMETTPTGKIRFTGSITNPADREFSHEKMHYLLFNALNEIIAIEPAAIPRVSANQTVQAPITTLNNLGVKPDMVAHFKTVADAWWATNAR